jgi:predicted TIM-barrel fold metal-dependent hydrolase
MSRPPAADGRVDVHAHHLPEAYVKALRDADMWLIGGIPVPEWSPQLALEFMDRHGIGLQMLSLSDPGVEFAGARAPELARECNDAAATVIDEHGGRFGAFAALALQDIDQALAETERALDTLALHGVALLSNYRGRYLGDPVFAPLLDELDRRGAWVMVHPAAVAEERQPELPVPRFVAEYPFDTTRTFISLLLNGVFHNHPRIHWQFAHGGGTLPMLRARLAAMTAAAKELGAALGMPEGGRVLEADSAGRALAGCFYDTALVADEPALLALQSMAGSEHLLFGSDWPFAQRLYGASQDPQPALGVVFEPSVRAQVDRLNAARELQLP